MTNKVNKIKSIGEPFDYNGWKLALVTMENGEEGHVFKKTSAEIDVLRTLKEEVPYKLNNATDGTKVLMTIYSLPDSKENKKGYAETASAKKEKYWDDREKYWYDKGEFEKTELTRRDYYNLVTPFFLELLKVTLPKIGGKEDADIAFTKAIIDDAISKANELYNEAKEAV